MFKPLVVPRLSDGMHPSHCLIFQGELGDIYPRNLKFGYIPLLSNVQLMDETIRRMKMRITKMKLSKWDFCYRISQ